jgi:hypothetical protein
MGMQTGFVGLMLGINGGFFQQYIERKGPMKFWGLLEWLIMF